MITDAQLKNLMWLHDHGGSAIIDQYGRLLAAGETRAASYQPSFLRLVASGYIMGNDGRLSISHYGHMVLREQHGVRI